MTRFRTALLDDPPARDLLTAYEGELVGFGIVLHPGEAGSVDALEMVPPRGLFLLGHDDDGDGGVPVACGGVRRLAADVAEIKRMYVAPSARRRGVAGALLARLESEARALGCRVVRLDTGAGMVGALRLYRAAGYVEIPDYNGNPHAAHWLEKSLGGLPA